MDVTSGEVTKEDLPAEAEELWLGGAGLGAWLTYHLVPAGADPLDVDNVVVFTPGLVNGAPVVTPGTCTFTATAASISCPSLSMAQGPAITTIRLPPISTPPQETKVS